MTDEDRAVFTPPVAAIPSRGLPGIAKQTAPAFLSRPSPGAERKTATRKKRQPKHSRKKTTPVKTVIARPARKVAAGPKNPNRPLEMKNKLYAVLASVATLSRDESVRFINAVRVLEGMPRSSRKHVLEALGKVYG